MCACLFVFALQKKPQIPPQKISCLDRIYRLSFENHEKSAFSIKQKKDSLHQQPETSFDLEFAEELSCPPTSTFSWPPPPEDDHNHPTAAPLYIPPPGTQHVQVTTQLNDK